MHRQVIEDAYYVGGARFPPSTVEIIIEILITRPLKVGGLLIMGLH